MRLISLLLALVAVRSAWGAATVQFDPPAPWVQMAEADLAPSPPENATYGFDYLLLDRQVKLSEQASFHHIIYRITSEGSLQDGSSLSWDFSPEYETFILHHVRVIRDGQVQERLQPDRVKVIQQERDLERHMLDGKLTALLVLEDIRVGDVVDYAYTRVGFNPTFHGKLFTSAGARWTVPIRRQRLRFLVPPDRTLYSREYGDVPFTFTKTTERGETCLNWEGRNEPATRSESEVPEWYPAFATIQFGEFSTWEEVVKWALPLYSTADLLTKDVRDTATQLTQKAHGETEKALALLEFVQRDVRYLGMELGAGSYQPRAPAEVLKRRFGDCKDKVLLFCALAEAVGLRARPALVNTDFLGHVAERLPSPGAFDHVIVALNLDGNLIWLDPTLTHQKGTFATRGLPEYGKALLIKPGQTELVAVDVPSTARPTTRIEEEFRITDFDQPAQLKITTVCTGRSADSMRRHLTETAPQNVVKDYVNYYASTYPGITSEKNVQWDDDPVDDKITVVEEYRVAKLWEVVDEKTGKLRASFYPKSITDYAVKPRTIVRTMPLAIDHPTSVDLRISVHLPEDWTIHASESAYESDGFHATEAISGKGPDVVMDYTWRSKADHVSVDRVSQHLAEINRFRDSVGYNLTYTKAAPAAPAPPPAFQFNWKMLFLDLVVLAVIGYWGTILWRPAPPEPPLISPAAASLQGLGGWLVLVGIGVVLKPFVLTYQVVTGLKDTFDQNVWERLTTSSLETYRPGLAAMIVAENIGNALLIGGSVLVIALFFGRRRAFPKAYISVIGFNIVFIVVDHVVAQSVDGTDKSATLFAADFVRMLMQAAIWIPYVLVSRRVRATFVR